MTEKSNKPSWWPKSWVPFKDAKEEEEWNAEMQRREDAERERKNTPKGD